MWTLRLAALVAAILMISINGARSQLNANPKIPDHLLECYRNSSIYYRGGRYPSSLRSLLDLIRKVESTPTGRNMNAREMSLALTYYLRLDGIVQTPNFAQTENIIPFAPGGDEYYKHRLTLVGLLPKANQPSSYNFFNESLSTKELCNLHFMLSYSIDAYKRDDEQCSSIIVETSRQNVPDYYPNRRRLGKRSAKTRHSKEMKLEKERLEKKLPKKEKNEKYKLKNGKWVKEGSRHRRYVDGSEEEDKDKQVEELPPNVMTSDEDEKNQDFRIGNEHMIGVGADHILRGGLYDQTYNNRPSTKPKPIPNRPSRIIPKTLSGGFDKRTAAAVNTNSRTVIPDVPFSECPIENGVILTKYGSVTIGTVIAGIAAGLNRQYIDPTLLNVNPNDIKTEVKGVKVDNVWATTLAGNTADMILSLGIISDINQAVGLRGGWNDTFNPKWYLLQSKNIKYLTDVELRGALDGLWLGQVVSNWVQKYNTLKLSQVLDMYYSDVGSVFDPSVQACRRGDNLVKYAPTDDFKKQVHIFCQVMNTQRINTVTITDFTSLAENTVTLINSYIQQWPESCKELDKILSLRQCPNAQMDSSCGVRSSFTTDLRLDLNLNVIMIVDTLWDYDNLLNLIGYLAENEVVATPYQSNLTIYCGKDGKYLATISDITGLQNNFTQEVYRNCTSGMDIGAVYDQLINNYRKIFYDEKIANRMNSQAQVAIILPYGGTNLQNTSSFDEKRETMRQSFPDVRVIVATTGNKDSFGSLVNDTTKDLFNIGVPISQSTAQSLQPLIDRIKTTPQRISKTQCGSYYSFEEGTSSTIDNIAVGFTKFYKLHPNYFYSVDLAKITIKSIRGSPLTVCYSRTNDQPTGDGSSLSTQSPNNNWNQPQSPNNWNQPQATTPPNSPYTPYPQYFRPYARQSDPATNPGCKTITGDTFEIQLEDPCDDADTISECAPLWISIYAPLQNSDTISATCTTCRLPTNVEYQIGVEGLTCDSGVGALVFSPIIALISIIVICLSNNVF